MNKKYEDEIRNTFKDLMKEGKDAVWNYIQLAENFYENLAGVNEYDISVDETLKKVREDKKFDFQQYKEVRRFICEQQRLNEYRIKLKECRDKNAEDNDYIIL